MILLLILLDLVDPTEVGACVVLGQSVPMFEARGSNLSSSRIIGKLLLRTWNQEIIFGADVLNVELFDIFYNVISYLDTTDGITLAIQVIFTSSLELSQETLHLHRLYNFRYFSSFTCHHIKYEEIEHSSLTNLTIGVILLLNPTIKKDSLLYGDIYSHLVIGVVLKMLSEFGFTQHLDTTPNTKWEWTLRHVHQESSFEMNECILHISRVQNPYIKKLSIKQYLRMQALVLYWYHFFLHQIDHGMRFQNNSMEDQYGYKMIILHQYIDTSTHILVFITNFGRWY